LQRAQQPGLRLHRHVADFVEEQRAAGRLLELADVRATAPVKAPFSCPNSSLSISSAGMAAVLTATNGPSRRPPSWWIASATSSLPVPDSPRISTVRSLRSTRVIMR
jgi:hypothetical protein